MHTRRRPLLLILSGFAVTLAFATSFSGVEVPTIADCDALVLSAPAEPASYRCFVRSVRAYGQSDEAVRRLDALLSFDPGRLRARMALAMIEDMRGEPRAEELYRRVSRELSEAGDLDGEVYARRALAWRLGETGRLDEADLELELAMRAAETANDDELRAWVWTERASQARRRFEHALARRLYRRAEQVVFPEGPFFLQGYVLSGLGATCWEMGDLRAALNYFLGDARLRQSAGDLWGESTARYNVALLGSQLAGRGRLSDEEARALAEQALEVAMKAGNLGTEARVRMLLGQTSDGIAALAEHERALEIGRQLDEAGIVLQAQRNIAFSTFYDGIDRRQEAIGLLDRAIDEARALGFPNDVARGLILRASFLWLERPRAEAIRAYEQAFEAIERLRELQPEQESRARVFSQWTFPYYRLSGRLLGSLGQSTTPDDDLDLSLRTIERMRARMLLDRLDAAGVLGNEESQLEGTLRDLQGALDEDQAVLAYQLPEDRYLRETSEMSEGGAWLFSVTRDDARVFEVPRIERLEQQVDVFRGLFRRRDGGDASASVGLYRDLLAEALEALPESIGRLVIVPDRVLHGLPFEALRESADGQPLATRFEISYAPSAMLWLRFKQHEAPRSSSGVLALVDPEPADSGAPSDPLPHSRREARAMQRALGRGELRTGDQASEHFLKSAAPESYGVLYVAAHALTDEERPSRSAVVLAPGSNAEDGRLHIAEIVDLELDGKIVVLASCRSASGEVLSGEGVLGLAQGFFHAGARAVVGSLWPVRDAETASMMASFARELGMGRSVAGALTAARRSNIAAGLPAEAWAGLVVLGDGDIVPHPTPVTARDGLSSAEWIPFVAVSLGAFLLWFRARWGH